MKDKNKGGDQQHNHYLILKRTHGHQDQHRRPQDQRFRLDDRAGDIVRPSRQHISASQGSRINRHPNDRA